MRVKRALVSVSDKTGLEPFIRELNNLGVEIISTGGTKKFLEKDGIPVKDISEFTGFPEILNGRVKTLHPKVHGGLLAKRDNKEHEIQVKENAIEYIDMVIVNLYPFDILLQKGEASDEEMIENIDIGGPSMLRSAAKNYNDVIVVCDNGDYDIILEALKKEGDISEEARRNLASKVFLKTGNYDSLIHSYLSGNKNNKNKSKDILDIKLLKEVDLRYGENPHQKASFCKQYGISGNFSLEQLWGKELSYNNFLDLEAAWNMANDFSKVTCVIVKHNNPCGIGQAENIDEAYTRALSTDSVSAFGGIVASNVEVTKECANEIVKIFTECVIAPSYNEEALEILKSKKNLRVVKLSGKVENAFEIKRVFNGFLIQEKDSSIEQDFRCVTKKTPDTEQMKALQFVWIVSKHVKSNAIVLAQNGKTIGIGAGQMSRVDASELAIRKAEKAKLSIKGAVLASDAFFPFRDAIDAVASYNISAIVQPGGSVRDEEVINACNEHGIAMVFTGTRHFKH